MVAKAVSLEFRDFVITLWKSTDDRSDPKLLQKLAAKIRRYPKHRDVYIYSRVRVGAAVTGSAVLRAFPEGVEPPSPFMAEGGERQYPHYVVRAADIDAGRHWKFPDFERSGSLYGGDPPDPNEPIIPLYSEFSPVRRKVTLKIVSWVGTTAITAKHISCQLNIAENSLWSWTENLWQRPHGGMFFAGESTARYSARWLYYSNFEWKMDGWVRRQCKRYFPTDKYYIAEEFSSEEIDGLTWSYADYKKRQFGPDKD